AVSLLLFRLSRCTRNNPCSMLSLLLLSSAILLPLFLPPFPTLFPYTTLFRSSPAPVLVIPPSASFAPSMRLRRVFSVSSLILKRSEEHTSELQSRFDIVCRLLLEKKKCLSNQTVFQCSLC